MNYRTELPPAASELVQGDAGWVYLDVRTPEEFAAGHPPGAYNVPVLTRGAAGVEPNQEFVATVSKHFSSDAKLVVGCAAGGRSMRACDLLAEQGFTELVNMHGGFSGAQDQLGNVVQQGWAALGFPVETEVQPGRDWDALR